MINISLIKSVLFYAALICVLGFAYTAKAAPKLLKVMVLDTGADSLTGAPMCDFGHYDASEFGSTADDLGHGSNVASLIAQEAGTTGYCLIIVKVFNGRSSGFSAAYTNRGLEYALTLKPDIINLSWGGERYYGREAELVQALLKVGTKIVAASGNRGQRLGPLKCNYYPACVDPAIIVVGNVGSNSNYGPVVDYTINGNNKWGAGYSMSGSSQSAALYTGRLVRQMVAERRLGK